MLTYLLQIAILILSATSAVSLSDFIALPASTRAILSIVTATIAFLLAVFKLYVRLINMKDAIRRGITAQFQNANWLTLKALLLTSVDWIFDLIAAAAILNATDYSDEDRLQIFVVIGTWLGVSEEVFEFVFDIIIDHCDGVNVGICGVFELVVAIIEICFGIYLLSNIPNDVPLTVIGIMIESLILICLSCGCVLFCRVCLHPPEDRMSTRTKMAAAAAGM